MGRSSLVTTVVLTCAICCWGAPAATAAPGACPSIPPVRFTPLVVAKAPQGRVRIPQGMRNLDLGQALSELRSLGLYAEVPGGWPTQLSDDGSIPVGPMYPPPGTVVPAHSIVRFTPLGARGPMGSFSEPIVHPRDVVVPDLVGLPWRVAQACARGWHYRITRIAPLSARGSERGLDAFVVASQTPAPGTRLVFGASTAVSVTIATLDQHAALPAEADGPLARLVDIRVVWPKREHVVASSRDVSGTVSLGLVLDAVPWPLPATVPQPARCSGGATIRVDLRGGRTVTYGPCRRPPALDHLAGAMLEAQLFRDPPPRARDPYPHPVAAVYLVSAHGVRNDWFTPGGSISQPIRYPLRLLTWALADVLRRGGKPVAASACATPPVLVLELPSGRSARYGACAQPAPVERLRGAMEYARTHRAPNVLAWPVRR
ncbi:MAG: hypothetical protein ABI317_10070 [Gaiellales bacterium]